MTLGPRSLVGQVLLALAAGLFVAQAISAILLYRASENRRDETLINTLAIRLVQAEEREPQRARGERRRPQQERRFGRFRSVYTDNSPLLETDRRLADAEDRLRALFANQGLPVAEVVVVQRQTGTDPMVQSRPSLQQRIIARGDEVQHLYVAGIRDEGASRWRVARALEPRRNGMAMPTIIAQTLLIFAILMGLIYLILRRITRPLSALTARTQEFGASADRDNPLPEQGPTDVRRLIAAHNAMEARVGALLDEKDVMLGAIGHDLKTPLAALRVRIETVDNEAERNSMAQTIREIDRTLDEILALARIGHAQEPVEPTDLGALAESVISEFEATGADAIVTPGPRVVHHVRPTWLKRALRNLVANAVRYGGAAEVSIVQSGTTAVLQVDDRGPGIPEADLADICEPFARGEASRNRGTGGTGLGLTIARAIAERHGGTLTLNNREGGGLRAQIRLPG